MTRLTGLAPVLSLLAEQDPAGQLVPCELRALIVGPGALDRLPEAVVSCVPEGVTRPTVVLLVDETLILRDGQDLKARAELLLTDVADVRRVVLSDGHAELHVTETVVADAVAGTAGIDVLVALGGGTISDIGKLVAVERPGLPVVTVMTAASVDGYTDNVSVTLKDGVKRTVPSCWPDIVIADAETVATIKELIESRVRPAVAGDGGDIVFRGFRDGVVYLAMKGSCSGCPSSTATLKNGVQNLLRHFLPDVREVQAI